MDMQAMNALAKELIGARRVHAERETGGAYAHGQRVGETVLWLRRTLFPGAGAEDDVLRVAAWFHDIGKGVEPHARYGAALAREALAGQCSAAELAQVCGLIGLHCARDPENAQYPAAVRLLQDADLLDHYGTFTVWMEFLYSAFRDRSLLETAGLNEAAWWKAHCAQYRAELNYPISREIFDEKIAFVYAFYARMQVEARGGVVWPGAAPTAEPPLKA